MNIKNIKIGTRTVMCMVPETRDEKANGLLAFDKFVNDEMGLLYEYPLGGVASVHTIGMLFPIDIVIVNTLGVVLLKYQNVQSGRKLDIAVCGHYLVELPAGWCMRNAC